MNEAETKCDLCGQLGHDWRLHYMQGSNSSGGSPRDIEPGGVRQMTPMEQALAHAVAALATLNGQYANVLAEAARLLEFRGRDSGNTVAEDAWLQDSTVLHARDMVKNR